MTEQDKEDRKWLDKFEADFTRLQQNLEKVPLAELQTKYAKAWNTLLAEIECDADWFCQRYLQLLAFPRHPEDKSGNDWLDMRIATILEEEKRPGGRVEQYRAALTKSQDRERFRHIVWEIYNRLEREAFDPYWQRHCRWVGEPGNRWIYNDITGKFWCSPDKRPEEWKQRDFFQEGCWITRDWKGQDSRFPPTTPKEETA